MMANECKKRNLDINEIFNDENVEKLCKSLKLENLEDIYFSVSTLKYLPSSILSRLELHQERKKQPQVLTKNNKNSNGIIIAGSNDILCSLATCCNPVYGEDIVGYITRGYGVKVHSKNCPNIDLNNERIIEASWAESMENRYNTKLKVYIEDVGDILLKIITASTKCEIIIDSINLINRNKELFYDISCKVKNVNNLYNFIDQIRAIDSVKDVERIFI